MLANRAVNPVRKPVWVLGAIPRAGTSGFTFEKHAATVGCATAGADGGLYSVGRFGMRVIEIREKTASIASAITNAYIDFSKMTCSVVALITDVVRDGKPVVAGWCRGPA